MAGRPEEGRTIIVRLEDVPIRVRLAAAQRLVDQKRTAPFSAKEMLRAALVPAHPAELEVPIAKWLQVRGG